MLVQRHADVIPTSSRCHSGVSTMSASKEAVVVLVVVVVGGWGGGLGGG